MAEALTNVSFDGSPVQFLIESPLLACFDPLAVNTLRDFLPEGAPVEVVELLERVNADYPAVACFTIPEFKPGLFTLDPRGIEKLAMKRRTSTANGPNPATRPKALPSSRLIRVPWFSLILRMYPSW